MLGIILLLLALVFYFSRKRRYLSYFLYLGFMMGYHGGFGLWTDAVLGMKNMDCAIVYTFIINIYLLLDGKWHLQGLSFKKAYYAFLLFLGCSVVFSWAYYRLSPFQIIQGGRSFLLIFSLPILIRATPCEVKAVLKMLMWVCLVTSILYILQILIVKGPIMPYVLDWHNDRTTGLPRLYNSPANLHFFLALSFLCPHFFPKTTNVAIIRIIFFVTLLCTLGRTSIVTGIATIALALFLNGKLKKMANTFVVIGIMFIPFIEAISDRFGEGGTSNDIEMIMNGNFGKDYGRESDATMLYRFAWCYERVNYLVGRTIGEQIFGMGLCSDSQDWVHKRYNFELGLINKETGLRAQLNTPDISYGNMITRLGFWGMVIYLILCVQITKYFWVNRKKNTLFLLMSASTIIMFIYSLAGSDLSETKSFALMFFIMSLDRHKTGIINEQKN